MHRITKFGIALLIVFTVSCRKNPASSREEDRPVRQTLENQIPADAVKTPDQPITSGAIRLEVRWLESMPEINSSLVIVGSRIAPGPSYSGYMPEDGESLIIRGLEEVVFEDRETLYIEVRPPLREPDGIPEMTLLKIIE